MEKKSIALKLIAVYTEDFFTLNSYLKSIKNQFNKK